MQKSPVVAAAQLAVPQAQSAPLAAVPFVMVQVGTALQRPPLVDVSQPRGVHLLAGGAIMRLGGVVDLGLRVPGRGLGREKDKRGEARRSCVEQGAFDFARSERRPSRC